MFCSSKELVLFFCVKTAVGLCLRSQIREKWPHTGNEGGKVYDGP